MIIHESDVAVLTHSGATVFFSNSKTNAKPAAPTVTRVQNALEVAPWGEDNRFPQNIVNHMSACGVGQSTLKKIASALYGGGLIYGKVIDIDADGNEIFKPAMRGEYKEVDQFWKNNRITRFLAEYYLDYVYFANCYPELILNRKGDKIAGIVHQESCDCREKQYGKSGSLETVYISKIWGLPADQFSKFDPDKVIRGILNTPNPVNQAKADGKLIIERKAIDMYFPLDSLEKLRKDHSEERNFILPVKFPSPNKTYYQLPAWDGARLAGWIDIASKVPNMIKSMIDKAFSIKYHIEIPEGYFKRKFGEAAWTGKKPEERKAAREELLQAMDNFLSGSENAYKSFVSYFETDPIDKKEYDRIKITTIDSKSNVDKDLLTASTANSEIMIAMGVNPNIIGAGKPGGVYASNQGGSNVREGKLEHDSSLVLDRHLLLEPFQLIKEFNKWPDELEFRHKNTVLLTLDKGKQTQTEIA